MILSMSKMIGHIVLMIFMQLFLWTVMNAKPHLNASITDHGGLQVSEEARCLPFHRFIPPNTFMATIKDEDKEIHLTWKRVERYLANKHLPVYIVNINTWGPTHKKIDVMNSIGNFIIYHDKEHKSAIIYFENSNRIEGVIGKSYQICDLSIDQLRQPLEVDGYYIRKLSSSPHGVKKPPNVNPPKLKSDNVEKREVNIKSFNASSLRYRRDASPELFYIETLVFITFDIVQYLQNRMNLGYLKSLVVSYLLHFNAVDMIFDNLPNNEFKIYLNLAGLIIEGEDGAFSRITNYSSLVYENNEILDIRYLFDNFERYPNHFDFPFTRDSFDLILISTKRVLEFGRRKPNSWHSLELDIFTERQEGRLSSVPMAIVRSLGIFSSHCIVAHEIGKIIGIDQNDPFDYGKNINGKQCYGLMQSSQNYCDDCIKWSEESISQLEVFFRENRNRCFFLNKPRSLYPPGIPMATITPCRQCTCFGYHSYDQETEDLCPLAISSNSCDVALMCKKKNKNDELQSVSTILPFDGTLCGENEVCWNEKCVFIEDIPSYLIIPSVFAVK